MTYSCRLHDQQDLCWGNTSRGTSEESQELEKMEFKFSKLFKNIVFSFLQQNVWLLRAQHTLRVINKINKHLSKKIKKNIYVKEIEICKNPEIYG